MFPGLCHLQFLCLCCAIKSGGMGRQGMKLESASSSERPSTTIQGHRHGPEVIASWMNYIVNTLALNLPPSCSAMRLAWE